MKKVKSSIKSVSGRGPIMSGKFIKVKKVVLSTLTIWMVVSQLVGCGAPQSDLLKLLQSNEQITLEVMLPLDETKGEIQPITWEPLATLTNYKSFRQDFDDTLQVITLSSELKNGVIYVNSKGECEPNNTLNMALHNRKFLDYLSKEDSLSKILETTISNYGDLDTENTDEVIAAAINGYFNILPDATPNYANPSHLLSRAEFMTALTRSTTPVTEALTLNQTFLTKVGDSEYTLYAQQQDANSYLTLDQSTFTSPMTRAEAIYMIVNHFFADDYKNADPKLTPYTDAKNAGNLAQANKIPDTYTSQSNYKSYELQYAIQNPDQGLPESLYKALVVANQKGLLTTSTESHWDEGITQSEAINLIISACKQDKSIPTFSFAKGTIEGYNVEPIKDDKSDVAGSMGSEDAPETDEYQDQLNNAETEANEIDDTLTADKVEEVKIVEVLDQTMYAIKNCNIRAKDTTSSDKVGSLEYLAQPHVTGKTSNGWYQIEWGNTKAYVASTLLSLTKPSTGNTNNTGNTGGSTTNTGNTGNSGNSGGKSYEQETSDIVAGWGGAGGNMQGSDGSSLGEGDYGGKQINW